VERRRARRPPQRPLVLLLDGHADTREMYAAALPTFGFEIENADDVADAYRRAWETHPDVVVTEIALSEDRWTFIHDLKRDPRTRDIPVVVVTSQGHPCVRARALQEGCKAFLVKPCLPDDLANALGEILET
jgi:two-component system, cell cycle response regulator DivK